MGYGFGRGNRAPDTARAVAKAFYAGKKCKRGNCETDGNTYWLYGNAIARRIKDEDIPAAVATAICGGNPGRVLEYSFAGWCKSTTVRHLNALGVRASVARSESFINGNPCFSRVWYTPQMIAELLPAPPPPPKPPRGVNAKFVQMTEPLFA